MTTFSLRPMLTVALVVALIAYIGCSSSKPENPGAIPVAPPESKPTPTDTPTAAHTPETEPKPEPEPTPAAESPASPPAEKTSEPGKSADAKLPPGAVKDFGEWPDPSAVLLISGEQLGYLEPCGCTEGQTGGMLRRYVLDRYLAETRKWPVARIDLGSLIKDPATTRGGVEQGKIKFHIALKAMAAMEYDAIALSPEDLKVGVDEAVGQILNLPGERTRIVAANVSLAGLESKIVPSVRLMAGPLKIGVTAVVDPARIKALRDPSLDLFEVKPAEESVAAVLTDLKKDCDTLVLMVQGPPEEARRLAAKFPDIGIVVATSVIPDPPKEAEVVNGGKTQIITVGQRGKYVGVVGLYPNAEPSTRYKLATLTPAYDGPAQPIKALIEDEFRETLKAQRIVEAFPKHDFVNAVRGSRFVGAERCKECHPKSFAKWEESGHANAFESLVDDPKPNSAFDAECVSCHTTGFEFTSGWSSLEKTPHLQGNQCENCHGPASKHLERPDDKQVLATLHVSIDQADKNRLCASCHDEDNSPHFKLEKYWKMIDHKGLDDYKDPKVHQPRPVKAAAE